MGKTRCCLEYVIRMTDDRDGNEMSERAVSGGVPALDPDDTVVIFAREQAQRKADHAAGVAQHAFDCQMRLAGIGRPEHRGDPPGDLVQRHGLKIGRKPGNCKRRQQVGEIMTGPSPRGLRAVPQPYI